MSWRSFPRAAAALLLGAGLLGSSASTFAQQDEEFRIRAVQVRKAKRWIGVAGGHIPELLRSHLDIPEDEGLLVSHVGNESPAAEAGLKKNDVLLSVNGQPIRGLHDVADAVEAAGEEGIRLQWTRKGQMHSATVHPEARPTVERGAPLGTPQRRWFNNFRPPMRMRFYGPGVAVENEPLPDDLQVQIRKQGDKPAEIVVELDGKKWEVKEDQLNELPDDVRRHVEGYLGKSGGWTTFFDNLRQEDEVVIEHPDRLHTPWPQRLEPPGQIERRLERMNLRIDELFEELKRIRQDARQDSEKI